MEAKRRRLGEEAWRSLLGRFPGSGLTITEFCRREGVCLASFRRWRKRLDDAPATGGSVAVLAATPPAAFVDLGALGARRGGGRIELRLDLGEGLLLHLVRG